MDDVDWHCVLDHPIPRSISKLSQQPIERFCMGNLVHRLRIRRSIQLDQDAQRKHARILMAELDSMPPVGGTSAEDPHPR